MTMYEIIYIVCPICDLGQSGGIEAWILSHIYLFYFLPGIS